MKWAENANVGYMPQDTYEEFPDDVTLMDWIDQYRKEGDDETMVRGTLGRLLFSADDIKKSVKVLSGGEKGRMILGKLMLGRHNVLVMDEPTNHLDMESIESLHMALEKYRGHADLRLPRPRVRQRPGQPHHRGAHRRHAQRLRR